MFRVVCHATLCPGNTFGSAPSVTLSKCIKSASQIVPAAGKVPFRKYVRMAFVVQPDGVERLVCCARLLVYSGGLDGETYAVRILHYDNGILESSGVLNSTSIQCHVVCFIGNKQDWCAGIPCKGTYQSYLEGQAQF